MRSGRTIVFLSALFCQACASRNRQLFTAGNAKTRILFCHVYHLYPAVFLAIFSGCFTNCFPDALPALLALVVAAYSAGESAFIAASGKYRSPVLLDGLPDLVRHFCSVHAFKDC